MEATCGYAECIRKVVRDGMCIFHLPDKNQGEAEEFNSLLLTEIEKMQKDANLRMIDLIGFRFPRLGYTFPTGTRFEKEISFREVVFEGKADFSGSEFLEYASFDYAKFLGHASFDRAKFWSDAHFFQSEFLGEAGFRYVEFSGHTSFSGTKFIGGAYFTDSRQLGPASFMACSFSGDACFDRAKFLDLAYFDTAKFSAEASFVESEFSANTSFHRAEFSSTVYFDRSKVGGLLEFSATFFQTTDERILSSPIKEHTSFDEIEVDRGGEVRFEGGMCMSRISLHYANIQRFSFFDVKWGRLNGRASVMEHGILEERKRGPKGMEITVPKVTPEHVYQIYVRLRRNLERGAGRYPEAGDFFVNEKKMRELILQQGPGLPSAENLPEWLILKIYGWLALYGESIMRPIFWTVVAILGFTALRVVFFHLQTTDAKPYLDFLMESVMAFFQMRSEPGLDILERLISVPILGSLFIAFKRKFERR